MKLLFVYNARSGRLNKYLDIGHKLISPSTYQCSLCALTHDTFLENEVWKAFRTQNPLYMSFLHSDEFEDLYPNTNLSYPIILKEENSKLSIVLDATELNNLSTLEELIEQISTIAMPKVNL